MPFGLNVLPQFEQFHCGCQETNQIHSDPEIQQICFDIPHNISYNGKKFLCFSGAQVGCWTEMGMGCKAPHETVL